MGNDIKTDINTDIEETVKQPVRKQRGRRETIELSNELEYIKEQIEMNCKTINYTKKTNKNTK
jgi:hypothetical protein